MQIGICAELDSAEDLAHAHADFLEVDVQAFLRPQDPDEQAWQARLRQARDAVLNVLSANRFLPGSMKVVGPEHHREAFLDYARHAFRRAGEAGIEIIGFGSGEARRLPEGSDLARARGEFIELLQTLAPMAADHDLVIAVEPLGRGECNFITSIGEGADVVTAVAHPRIRLLADFYHMHCNGESPADLSPHVGLLAHVHLAEGEGRRAPGTAGEDFRPYLRVLCDGAYDGRISLECAWQDLATDAERGIAALRSQLADVGL